MNQSASGTFARAVDVPPILLCESNTVYFYEESIFVFFFSPRVLYGQQSVDSLVNSRITHLLERFLYMRPERICNAYMSYVRQKNEDVLVDGCSFLDASIRRFPSLSTLCRKQIRHQHSLLVPFYNHQS